VDAGSHLLIAFEDLEAFARQLLGCAGMPADQAGVVAEILVTADAMGHDTHGLGQLAGYLEALENGDMTRDGTPTIVSDRGAAVVWDGNRLNGVWLTHAALELAATRAREHGLCAIAIRRSHHIGCLAAYLPRVAAQGLMAIIASSDPSEAVVAPAGGAKGVFTPDPIAIAIPTEDQPILIDISASITTVGMSARLKREQQRFPGKWAVDAEGRPTDDPNAAFDGGALLPAGGIDHGHKGFGLALGVEALTQGLSGYGRADGETR
jgi:LDH2 family malate/lactate/ureidoglycolate dehydrogenase